MTPKILLSTSRDDPSAYIEAVQAAGGDPTAAYCPQYEDRFDGLILCGGVDVHPSYYGEPIDGTRTIDPQRDSAEMELVRAFLAAGKPIFGVCRGCQLLNIYFGGTLVQHLPTFEGHTVETDGVYIPHAATAEPGSLLAEVYGTEFTVNSHHHQAVKDLAPGFRVTMRSADDDVVEAIEHETLPIFAVQWHPERMSGRFATDDTVDGVPILRKFVEML